MRNLHFKGFKCDKKFALAFAITLICAFICGIVLYKLVISNAYLRNFADEYVFNVFNFKNSTLLLTHIVADLLYLYIILLISNFTKYKYISLILIFLRGVFFGVYTVILIGINSFGGVIVTVFVFLPGTLISLALCYIVADFSEFLNKKYVLAFPAVLAVADLAVYALLINVLFRIVIAIV